MMCAELSSGACSAPGELVLRAQRPERRLGRGREPHSVVGHAHTIALSVGEREAMQSPTSLVHPHAR